MATDMLWKEMLDQSTALGLQQLKTNLNEISTQDRTPWINASDGPDLMSSDCDSCNNISGVSVHLQRDRIASYSSSTDSSYGESSTSLDVSPQGDEYRCFSQDDLTDSDFSDDGNIPTDSDELGYKGIVNPNYQTNVDEHEIKTNSNKFNNNEDDSDSVANLANLDNYQKAFYDKPKFRYEERSPRATIAEDDKLSETKITYSPRSWTSPVVKEEIVQTAIYPVSGVFETTVLQDDESDTCPSPTIDDHEMDSNRQAETSMEMETCLGIVRQTPKIQLNKTIKQKNTHHSLDAQSYQKQILFTNDECLTFDPGMFDVYNIETALSQIKLEAVGTSRNYKQEKRRRNDREEIRRRLAMGNDGDEYFGGDRPGRKPSLQSRLQSGMNLQICFMNETISDNESQGSDSETSSSIYHAEALSIQQPAPLPFKTVSGLPENHIRPCTSLLRLPLKQQFQPSTEADFFACQAQLQAEARLALSQAKDMAHMQMEVDKQQLVTSPIREMVRCSLEKVGVTFPEDRRRLSRQILTEMNVAQLQVIVNDLHTQIETLNESLVKFLIGRDDLHMEQDSMLVDIEDLNRYLGGKEKCSETDLIQQNNHFNTSHKLTITP